MMNTVSTGLLVLVTMCVATLSLAQTSTTTLAEKTVCFLPREKNKEMATHGMHAVRYYANKFNKISWKSKFINRNQISTKTWVASWVFNGTDCDLLVGPGYSSIAVAMSPLVEAAWVDATATSTELSDKKNHPFFSRVIPTDQAAAQATGAVMRSFGWHRLNIICSNEPYGRSVSAGMSNAVRNLPDGKVDVVDCFDTNADEARVREAVLNVMASDTRLTFIAGTPSQTWFQYFLKVAYELEAHKSQIFLFSEAFCSTADRSYTKFEGSICATYTSNATTMGPFLDSYYQRDLSIEQDALRALGYTVDVPYDTNYSSIFGILIHDATHHGMSAIHSKLENTSATAQHQSITEYLRQHVTVGGTGTIHLEANGDRLSADLKVFNSQSNAKEVVIGYVVDRNFSFTTQLLNGTSTAGQRPVMFFFGRSTTTIPGIVVRESKLGTEIITVIAVAAVLVPAMIVVVLVTVLGGRSTSNAPTDSSKPFAMVFTDIQASTALWAQDPEGMSNAVEIHHQYIREILKKRKGYEVKTIGDSFMCAFKDADQAVNFAVDVQLRLMEVDGGTNSIDFIYDERVKLMLEEGLEVTLKKKGEVNGYEGMTNPQVWKGLRVRIGVHYGTGSIQFDEVSKGYDYYGTVVNASARVESVGHGGQVLITEAAYTSSLGTNPRDDVVVVDMGLQPLRGVGEQMRLYQVTPKSLTGRLFPPLRLEMDVGEEMEDELELNGESTDTVDTKSMHSLAHSIQAGEDPVEHHVTKMCKNKWPNPHAQSRATNRIMEAVEIINLLLATSSGKYQTEFVEHICERWRVHSFSELAKHGGSRGAKYKDVPAAILNKLSMTEALVKVVMSLEARENQGQARSERSGSVSSAQESAGCIGFPHAGPQPHQPSSE